MKSSKSKEGKGCWKQHTNNMEKRKKIGDLTADKKNITDTT